MKSKGFSNIPHVPVHGRPSSRWTFFSFTCVTAVTDVLLCRHPPPQPPPLGTTPSSCCRRPNETKEEQQHLHATSNQITRLAIIFPRTPHIKKATKKVDVMLHCLSTSRSGERSSTCKMQHTLITGRISNQSTSHRTPPHKTIATKTKQKRAPVQMM